MADQILCRGEGTTAVSGKEKGGKKEGQGGRTTISTVSYRFITIPSLSTMGTALIPRSEKICTTSKTDVSSVAVARGKYGSVGGAEGFSSEVGVGGEGAGAEEGVEAELEFESVGS